MSRCDCGLRIADCGFIEDWRFGDCGLIGDCIRESTVNSRIHNQSASAIRNTVTHQRPTRAEGRADTRTPFADRRRTTRIRRGRDSRRRDKSPRLRPRSSRYAASVRSWDTEWSPDSTHGATPAGARPVRCATETNRDRDPADRRSRTPAWALSARMVPYGRGSRNARECF